MIEEGLLSKESYLKDQTHPQTKQVFRVQSGT